MEPAHPSPTPPTLSDAIRSYLAEPRYATLATLTAEGPPHQAVIWYALDGDSLLINSRRGRHWPRNLLRDGDAAIADIQAMARHYGKDPASYAGQDRVTYRVTIQSTFEYGD